ncbi:MAG TPA: hypothetical protein VIY08_07625 [Candidatus Nitrosocosmicus sp.]
MDFVTVPRSGLSNSFIVRPINDLKSSGFLDNLPMKAKREHTDRDLVIVKLFANNYKKIH